MSAVSVGFDDSDVKKCMPHLKGVQLLIALESVEDEFYVRLKNQGLDLMKEILDDAGWGIGGKSFINDGGW